MSSNKTPSAGVFRKIRIPAFITKCLPDISAERFPFLDTVKFKVAMWYAALFTLSAVVAFVVFYYMLSLNMLRLSDNGLKSMTSEIVFEYLTGNKYRKFDKEIPLSEIPREAVDAIQKKIAGFTPRFAFEREAYGVQLQTIIGSSEQKLFEARLESGGTVFSRQLNTHEHIAVVQRTVNQKLFGAGNHNIFIRMYRPDGRQVIRSEQTGGLELPKDPLPGKNCRTMMISDQSFRVYSETMFDGNVLEVGTTLEPMRQRLEQYSKMYGLSMPLVLIAGAFCGWLIARKFMTGVQRVSEAALDIAGGDFSRRVMHGNEGEEIDRLVDAFNRMNANTEKLLDELRMVTDSIAHDLRTPLTRMRGMVEVTFEGPQTKESYQDMAGAVADECTNMLQMLNTMLEITRTGSRPEELMKAELDLNQILRQGHDLLSPLAEVKNIDFKLELPETSVTLSADKLKIQRMISNLLENAVKFTPEGGRITLGMTVEGSKATIKVSDTGCGISEEDQQHIFERFFRSDLSRSMPGNGLGLSLVEAIVLAHNGRLAVESTLGKGTTFIVTLPVKVPAQIQA